MKNYRMVLQYEGTRYQGWQRQDKTDNTIQGKLESVLSKMQGTFVKVDGSGRTDAGVHAKGQVASFQIETDFTEDEIMEYLNRYLPEDIAVIRLSEAGPRFHARLNAVGKTYCYRIWNSNTPDIFNRRWSYTFTKQLNVERMKKAAELFCGTHDFQGFTSKKMKKSTVRTIDAIEITKQGNEIIMTFSGDGFLYHMVRIMVGTLLEVGTGEREPETVSRVLESKKREEAGPLVPGQGLTLMEVRYQ